MALRASGMLSMGTGVNTFNATCPLGVLTRPVKGDFLVAIITAQYGLMAGAANQPVWTLHDDAVNTWVHVGDLYDPNGANPAGAFQGVYVTSVWFCAHHNGSTLNNLTAQATAVTNAGDCKGQISYSDWNYSASGSPQLFTKNLSTFPLDSQTMPWDATISPNPPWLGDATGLPPYQLGVVPGQSLTITASGTILYAPLSGPWNANGDRALEVAIGITNFPNQYVAGNSLGVAAALAAFADSGGRIISVLGVRQIFEIGVGPTTITAPAGAAFLLLGINDIAYADNSGHFTITINTATADVDPFNLTGQEIIIGSFFAGPAASVVGSTFSSGFSMLNGQGNYIDGFASTYTDPVHPFLSASASSTNWNSVALAVPFRIRFPFEVIVNAPYPNRLQLTLGDFDGPFTQAGALGAFDPVRDLQLYVDGSPLNILSAAYDGAANRYLMFTGLFNQRGVIQAICHVPDPPFKDTNSTPLFAFALFAVFDPAGDP